MLQSKIGFYGHVKQYHKLKAEIDQAILEVLESGIYVLGPQLAKFEEELARYMNVEQAVGVNSGTDALLHYLEYLLCDRGSDLAVGCHPCIRGL